MNEKDPMSLDYAPVKPEEAVKAMETPAQAAERMAQQEKKYNQPMTLVEKSPEDVARLESLSKKIESVAEKKPETILEKRSELKKEFPPRSLKGEETLRLDLRDAEFKLSYAKSEGAVPIIFGSIGAAGGAYATIAAIAAGAPIAPLLLAGGLTAAAVGMAGIYLLDIFKASLKKKRAEREYNHTKFPQGVVAA